MHPLNLISLIKKYSTSIFLFISVILFVSCDESANSNKEHPAYNNPAVLPFTEAILLNPNDASQYYKRSMVLSQMNLDSLALLDLNTAIEIDGNNASYYIGKGEVLNYLGQHDNAIAAFTKAQELEPKDLRIKIQIIKSLLLDNKVEAAKAKAKYLNELLPTYPDVYFWLGQIAAKEKDTNLAIQYIQKSLSLDPTFYEASLQLADYYADLKKDVAIEQYKKTYALDTTDVFPLFQIGMYYESQNKLVLAKKAYYDCLDYDADFTDAYIQIGELLLNEDSINKAKRIFDLAVKTEPSNAYAYAQLGYAYEKLNVLDSAKMNYANALNLNRQNTVAKEGMKRISKKSN